MSEYLEPLGYFGAFLGAIFEGEILLLSFLQLARFGYTSYYGILFAAFLGTMTADWSLFLSGRRKGKQILEKKPHLQAKFAKLDRLLKKYHIGLMLAYRFMYGFRVVLPLVFGMSEIPTRRFALFSLISTALWLSALGMLGSWLGETILDWYPLNA